ncbi:MAG: PEP-CTERM sorting domain-containing protein [Verrucomicrobia bacterium]|nr:PEP-CTERM sorting domain-containing protein [Verrucomicrobiota bacterium]
MKFHHALATVIGIAAVIQFTPASQAALQYQLYDIGTLGGGYSAGWGINNAGTVVGEGSVTGDLSINVLKYSGATLSSPGSSQNVGSFGAGGYTEGFSINSSGQIAGAYYSTSSIQRAFINTGGSFFDIGTLGGDYTSANAINDTGQVAGTGYLLAGNHHAFRYSGGIMTDLGTLGGTQSTGASINLAGTVSGTATMANGSSRAFIYTTGGGMVGLGTLGGSDSTGGGINDLGQVTGFSSTGAGSSHAFIYSGGPLLDIGTLGGNSSYASGINNLGMVVGNSDTLSGARAFVYESGIMYDLNNLVTNLGAAGFNYLDNAISINDSGWVTGYGTTLSGENHAFLALVVPVPEPATGMIGLLCIGAAALTRRRGAKVTG